MRNLLLEEDKKIVRREYRLRLLITALSFSFFTFLFGAVFLVPSFFLSRIKEEAVAQQAAITRESIAAREEEASSALLEETRSKILLLQETETQMPISEVFKVVVDELPTGVSVSNLSFRGTGTGNEVVLQGNAGRREQLLLYKRQLEENEDIFTAIDLPISSLVSDENISFTMRATGEF